MIKENTTVRVIAITKEITCDLCKAYKNFEAKSRHGVNKLIADSNWIINGSKGDRSMRNLTQYGNDLCNTCYIRIRKENAVEGDEYRYTHWDDDTPNNAVLWNPTLIRGIHRTGLVHRYSYNLITDFAVWVIEAWVEPQINDMFIAIDKHIYTKINHNYGEWVLLSDVMSKADTPATIYQANDSFIRQIGHKHDGIARVWHLKEDD